MKTTVVCGMLGSGKTTFIRHFVEHIQGRAVVLVNDFGKSGIDGDIVRAKALVNTLQGPFKFDLSFSNVEGVPFDRPVSGSRLIVIGKNLDREALSAAI